MSDVTFQGVPEVAGRVAPPTGAATDPSRDGNKTVERRPLRRYQTHGSDETNIDRTRTQHHTGVVSRRHVGHAVACVRHAHVYGTYMHSKARESVVIVKPTNAVRPAKDSAGGVTYDISVDGYREYDTLARLRTFAVTDAGICVANCT